MLSEIQSATLLGITGLGVRVEVDVAPGLPGFAMVGLPENTLREARVRVQAAMANSGFSFPTGKITVNLAPAHIRKDSTGLDVAIALGILACMGCISLENLEGACFLGELSLSGELRPVRGVLSCAQAAFQEGAKRIFVPAQNASEAALVEGIEAFSVKHFSHLVAFLQQGQHEEVTLAMPSQTELSLGENVDLSEVKGQYQAKRALEVAAAGGHNLLFVGGPGSGKTMMAKRLSSILPPLSYLEALEVTQVYSAAGFTLGGGLIQSRPFRSPHHSTSKAGLAGGGSGVPRPGELSLATHGVLFLDELPEFQRSVIEVLRQPLESGEVVLSRANGTLAYPAKMMLIAAMNPCPCGYFGSPRKRCKCSAIEVSRYRSKISGPLLDRIDLHVHVPPVEIDTLHEEMPGESSKQVQQRVSLARALQAKRYGEGKTNANVGRDALARHCKLNEASKKRLKVAMERLGLSARAHDRILRVSRTLADLEEAPHVDSHHIAEAIQYRGDEGASN